MYGFTMQIDPETGAVTVFENVFMPFYGTYIPQRHKDTFSSVVEAQAYIDQRTKELYGIESEDINHE